MQKNNKGRNTYFLYHLFRIIGLMYHFSEIEKSFYVLLDFVLFTGLALKYI